MKKYVIMVIAFIAIPFFSIAQTNTILGFSASAAEAQLAAEKKFDASLSAKNIDQLVKEELLLAVPDHVLCRENCKGMCAVCGVNKNLTDCGCGNPEVDPRWAGLVHLVNRKTGE